MGLLDQIFANPHDYAALNADTMRAHADARRAAAALAALRAGNAGVNAAAQFPGIADRAQQAPLYNQAMPGGGEFNNAPPGGPNPLDNHLFDLYLNHAIEQAAARGDRQMGGR